jgi:hypothetical protein
MWTLTVEDVTTKPKCDIHPKSFMFTVRCNLLGFRVIDKLPTGAKMNNDYFITNILAPFAQKLFPTGRNPHTKRLIIHPNDSADTSRAADVDIS